MSETFKKSQMSEFFDVSAGCDYTISCLSWRLFELPYWFKVGFAPKILEFFCHMDTKYNVTWGSF